MDQAEIASPQGDLLHAVREREVETLTALRRRWRMIALIVCAASVLVYALCQLIVPLYSATVTLIINPLDMKQAIPGVLQTVIPPSEEAMRKNEIAIIRSGSLAQSVITRLSLDREPEFNPVLRPSSALQDVLDHAKSALSRATAGIWGTGEADPSASGTAEEQARQKVVDIFLNRLSTPGTEASRVIEIRFYSEKPQRAAQVASAIAGQYISQKLEVAETQAAAQNLRRDIEVISKKIYDSERQIGEMRKEQGLMPAANVTVAVEQVSELNRQLATATAERVLAEGRLAELQSVRGSPASESAASVLGSPLIQRLQGEMSLLTARIGDMSSVYGEDHPKLAQSRAELRGLRAQTEAEVAKIANAYRNAVAVAKAKENSLRREVELLKAQLTQADASEVKVRPLERQTEASKALLTQLVTRLNEATAQAYSKGPQATVISPATVPRSPSYPPKLAIIAVVFLFSATGGAILAVLLERRDTSVRSMVQIRQLTSARVLGAIPFVKDAVRTRRLPHSYVLSKQRSLFVENLRSVWFQLDSSRPVPGNVVLITSSVSGEGKSSVAASLARMLALAGRRVLIIDADLRNPSVHQSLGMARSPGFAELITAESRPDEVLQVDRASGIYCVAAGAPVSSPADLLQSARLPEVLRYLSASFDCVIIDSSPVLAVHDAMILGKHADGTIMVVRWGKTKIATISTALQRMSEVNIPVKGVVLSMVDSKKYGLYNYPDSEIFSCSLQKYYAQQ
jgi:succinoglycan biosynthesis transport protein ExoP